MHKTKKHEGMGATLTPLLASEFAAALNVKPVPDVLEPGFVRLEDLARYFGITEGQTQKKLKQTQSIERKQFKLPGMRCSQYFYRIKK
jgi:hypothetical protein